MNWNPLRDNADVFVRQCVREKWKEERELCDEIMSRLLTGIANAIHGNDDWLDVMACNLNFDSTSYSGTRKGAIDPSKASGALKRVYDECCAAGLEPVFEGHNWRCPAGPDEVFAVIRLRIPTKGLSEKIQQANATCVSVSEVVTTHRIALASS